LTTGTHSVAASGVRSGLRGRRVPGAVLAATAAVALGASACSGGTGPMAGEAGRASTTTTQARPPGPVADLSHEISGGNGPFAGEQAATGLAGAGYVEHEYVAAGTAVSYRPTGPLTGDGRWSLVPDGSAPYRTRVLVRRPGPGTPSSGTVVVEWLNVSGSVDADPEYTSLREELIRQGDTWVGVSAQLIGVAGGPALVTVPGAETVVGKGLVRIDPARYGTLVHPGDGFSFDMFTQVARALRAGGTAMGGRGPQRLIAAGESQSAIALTTYIDGVEPLTRVFDGFYVHSRAAGPLPLVGPGAYADLAGSVGRTPTIFRTDTGVPILDIQAESDVTGVLDSSLARQSDSAHVRLWEVAGTSHADAHLMGPIARNLHCGAAINNGPMHLVAKAALHALDRWIRTGTPPPIAPRIQLAPGTTPRILRDADGIALGGIRTPPVDVPVDVLSGVPGPDPALICILLGSTTPLPPARLAARYASRSDYEGRYGAATAATIAAGYVLTPDLPALFGFAAPSRVAG
jgi:hypothetical protein